MQSPRLPRFNRSREAGAIHLTDRDIQILRLVHRHRFLRSSHIVELIGESRQQILRRLQLLFHNGYLERPRAQIEYYHLGGTREIVYGLANKGEVWLVKQIGLASQNLRCGEKNRAVRRMFLKHALMVSDTIDHEVGNVIKCLKAGYRHVCVICTEQSRLAKIQTAVTNCLSAEETACIRYFQPEEFLAHLRELAIQQPLPPPPPETKTVLGKYKVKTKHANLDEKERRRKEQQAHQAMSEELKKKKRKQ